jgi:hypothetical protein
VRATCVDLHMDRRPKECEPHRDDQPDSGWTSMCSITSLSDGAAR